MYPLFVAFIADGYVYEVDTDDRAASLGYWYSLRHEERDCPVCAGDDDCEGCDRCDGYKVVTGEPFTVTRYDFASEADRDSVIERLNDASDGYDRAGILAALTAPSTDVVEWEPEEERESYRRCPCCRVYRPAAGDKWRACPECQGTRDWPEFRAILANADRSDPYGFVAGWLFALADEAYCRGILADELTAAAYQPGLSVGRVNPDSEEEVTAATLTDDAIVRGWRLLFRYRRAVIAAGRDY